MTEWTYITGHETSPVRKPMAPWFLKIPIPAIPTIAVRSGLRCSDESCYALFTTLDDITVHASTMHAGKIGAVTCNIHECTLESGETRLYHVLDEAGEQGDHVNRFEILLTRSLKTYWQRPTTKSS